MTDKPLYIARRTPGSLSVFGRALITQGLLTALFLTPIQVQAEIYKVVDEYGNVSFTDTPPKSEKSEKIEIDHINTQPAIVFKLRPDEPASEIATPSYKLKVASPVTGYKVSPAADGVNVQAKLSSPLMPEHKIQWYLDGAKFGKPQTKLSGRIPLNFKHKGKRKINAAVVDSRGSVLASSASTTIFVLRSPKKQSPQKAP